MSSGKFMKDQNDMGSDGMMSYDEDSLILDENGNSTYRKVDANM